MLALTPTSCGKPVRESGALPLFSGKRQDGNSA